MKFKIVFLFLIVQNFIYSQSEFLSEVKFSNIGPTIMSGRVVDLCVNPDNPIEFYVAYASGGLWYTKNNGSSFEPVMDTAKTINCGSFFVDWKSGTIWVGTGEINSSRSSYAGVGLLVSYDKGKNWSNIGLRDSHHISKVWVNPNDQQEIVVAVIGHLYTSNEERGIFKTNDGGKTWKKSLFIDSQTGVIDLVVSPYDQNVMYASSWEKDRKAWNFKGNGSKSGIYKSENRGESWALITLEDSGFPVNEGVGRIGLAVFDSKVVYAVVDNQNKRRNINKELDSGKSKDANSALFETEVIGCELYKSIDGGKNWSKTNNHYIDDFYYSYGYYFGNISVDKNDSSRIYMGGVPLIFSNDGGKTFEAINKGNVHADHHVVWINPKNPNHIINGNDGGINITYDNGLNWIKCNNQAVGQLYAINVDNENPYNVYGGFQDNGVWVGNSDYQHSLSWQQYGKYGYEELIGGDGMQIQIDNRNSNIVYTGFQFGNYYRIDRKGNKMESITPKVSKEEEALRFNWQTPISLSFHNQDILYIGSNFLHRSMDQGVTWQKISPDLTKGAVEGNVAFGTITSFSESKFQFGLLYVGTDDGLLHVSKDGGVSWTKISDSLPQDLWVSRVQASVFKKERVYLSLNGYRNDDFHTYIYVSEDYGQTWNSICSNLLDSPVNVILEDSENENILYVGTDNGLYVTFNRGGLWYDFSSEMPSVAVHDLVIQKRAKELLVATHGRSIYKVSLDKIQQLDKDLLSKSIYLFDIENITKSKRWGKSRSSWGKAYMPKEEIWFFSNSDEEVKIEVVSNKNLVVFQKAMKAKKGLNLFEYDLKISKDILDKKKKKNKGIEVSNEQDDYLPVSKYKVVISKGENKVTKEFSVLKEK